MIASPSYGSRVFAVNAHSTPGARTAWHTHPNGQTIFVTEGVGLCQRPGGPIEVIRPGDRVYFEPGEEHWHGAAPDRFMTHLAMLKVDEQGNTATWGKHVMDEEYGQQPGCRGQRREVGDSSVHYQSSSRRLTNEGFRYAVVGRLCGMKSLA
ncbi:MAG TPA: cupin domain-containing protein [Thermomicrobiales bacterium]|nr:cupin domain-containing protein [Thermomicrobiales bacterium]